MPLWAEQLAARSLPRHDDHAGREAFARWRDGEPVVGLPPAMSEEGQELIRMARTSLR